MRDLMIQIKANATGYMNAMRDAQQRTKDFGKEVERSAEKRQALDELGRGFTRVGALAVAGSALVIKAAMDWEQAWTGVLKTVDGTDAQLAKLETGLRNLATETGFAHSEVAAVAEAAGQLGISTSGIEAFTETVLAMGVSTNLAAEDAAVGLARFRNIMGSSEADIARMGASMVDLGNNFATTESEILAMGLRLAGAGRQAGLSEADVLGLSAAMSSVGIEAEAGGTAMSLTMKRIGREVDSQGPKLETFARLAGMTSQQFARAWKDDAGGALQSFVAGLDRASQSGESVNQILTDLGVTGIRESDALLRLSGNAEGLADALDTSSDAWRQNVALMAEAEKFYGTTQSKVKQAWAEIKDAAITAGEGLLPVVKMMAEAVGSFAGLIGSIPGPVLAAGTAIAGIGGTALLAMGGLIKLHGAIESTRDALALLEISGGAGGRALSRLGAFASRAALGLGALAAIQAAGEAITKRNSDEISGLAKELAELGDSGKVGKDLESIFGKDLGGQTRHFARDIRDLGGALVEFDKYGDDNFATRLGRRMTPFNVNAGVYDMVNGIKDIDAAFAQLSRSKPEDAIRSFEKLRDTAIEQGASIEDVSRAFPTMTELLRSSSEAMGGTSDAAEVLTGDLSELAPAAQAGAEALAEARQATSDAAMAFFDMSAGLDDAETSFADWMATLEDSVKAQQNWSDNVVKAMQRGVSEGVIQEFEKLGPAGARMLDELVDGSQANIDHLNNMLSDVTTTAEDLAYIRNDLGIPIITQFETAGADGAIETAARVAAEASLSDTEVTTTLTALDYSSDDIKAVLKLLKEADQVVAQPAIKIEGVGAASGAIAGIQSQINALKSKTITLTVNRVATGAQAGGALGFTEANGGVVDYFADGGMRESHVAQIAPAGAWRVWAEPETGGEAYIPLHQSKRQRSLEIWAETGKRLGVQGYANGGVSGGGASPVGYMLPPGAQFRLVGADLIELVDSRVAAGARSNERYMAAGRRGR